MTDQAPVSSRHVRLKLHNLAFIPENIIDRMEIETRIGRDDRAVTTVRHPGAYIQEQWQQRWDEILNALRYLEGADQGIPFAGASQTFEVTWDGICRPI